MNPIVVLLMNTSIPMSFGASTSKNVPDNIHIYAGEFLVLGHRTLGIKAWDTGSGMLGKKVTSLAGPWCRGGTSPYVSVLL